MTEHLVFSVGDRVVVNLGPDPYNPDPYIERGTIVRVADNASSGWIYLIEYDCDEVTVKNPKWTLDLLVKKISLLDLMAEAAQ